MTSIGVVRYLNTAPLIEGLDKLSSLTLSAAVPSKLVGMLTSGEVDLALASIIDAARPAPEGSDGGSGLTLIPAGMIGCDGPTLTVRLFSAVPFEGIRRIHADTDSHTSVTLARVVLDRLYRLRPEVVDFDARERVEVSAAPRGGAGPSAEWPETLLLIGDKVVADPPPAARYPHQLDLGEAWHTITGLPFVYAMWMCRTADLADAEKARAIAETAALLDRQLRHNLTRLDWLIEKRAPLHRWPVDLARRYLGELLRYRVGARERRAVGEFFSAAAAIDAGVPVASPCWFEWDFESRGVLESARGPAAASLV